METNSIKIKKRCKVDVLVITFFFLKPVRWFHVCKGHAFLGEQIHVFHEVSLGGLAG